MLLACWSPTTAQNNGEGDKKDNSSDKARIGKKGGTPGDRWEGVIIRSNSDKSTLTVRKVGSSVEKVVQYDSSTKWVNQEHGSKKVNDIDSTEVKDGDRVICQGSWDKDGVLHATLISKRLSHPD